jgi:hypothetical protein
MIGLTVEFRIYTIPYRYLIVFFIFLNFWISRFYTITGVVSLDVYPITMLTPSLCFMMPCTFRMQDQTICYFSYSTGIFSTQMEAARNPEEEAKAMVSMRLAYQDLSVQHMREEERLKAAQI